MKITMADIRACRMCARGAREFFRAHGIDWTDFLKNGVDIETIRATDDAMALKVVEYVERK